MRDVAQAAGLSTATVSRALRGLAHVDQATRDKVIRVAAELDYVISPSASRLASGRTGTIAILTPFVARWYFATVLSGIETVLHEAEVDLLLFEVGDPSFAMSRVPTPQRLRGRADGLLVLSLTAATEGVEDLLSLGLPVSMVGVSTPGVASISIDDVEAARTATQHLVNLGHERIGLISGTPMPSAFTPDDDRRRGFMAALESSGLAEEGFAESFGYFTIAGGESAMASLLARPSPPTAVFAMSDEMAFGAMRALQRYGLRPGHDVAIAGVDGHDLSELLELTTVAQPVAELGRRAAHALLAGISGSVDGPQSQVLPTNLVVRSSTVPQGRS